MPFDFEHLSINDVILIKPKIFGDSRGFFTETFKKSDFIKHGIVEEFVQDNHSKSSKGVLRGLHYQVAPKGQSKLLRCTRGTIYDVAVDIRPNSNTFGEWCGTVLSEENKNILYIPKGFAHGFVVLSDDAELLYKASSEYSPEHDRGICWNDPDIGVDWGIDFKPLLSEKDKNQPRLKDINVKEVL